MNASRIFRNFLNVTQTAEDLDLNTQLSPEETTQVIGYMNFHYGLEENVVRAMFGTPGLIPVAFLEAYDPDRKPSTELVNDFLGEISKEDVGDFLDAVSKTPEDDEYQLLGEVRNFVFNTKEDGPIVITSPATDSVQYPIGMGDATPAAKEEPIKLIEVPNASLAISKPQVQVLRLNKKFKGR
jgi:hypothetical protein